jgi:RNA ligase
MQDPRSYFEDHDLWDLSKLRDHAKHNLVNINQSTKNLSFYIAHYSEDAQWENKWNTFTEMCRGIIFEWFAGKGKILTWPYAKFHNLGAVPETDYNRLKTLGEFEVAEKLDGSMIMLYYDRFKEEYRCSTKGSLDSEHGEYATSILPEHLKQPKWVEEYTLMFELIAKRFQIVIDYKKKDYQEGLYLIGARHLKSGRLLSYKEVQELATELNLPTIKTYKFSSLDELIDTAKNLPVLEEGFVLRFKDGLMVKVKGDAYLRAHRFISHLSDRHILEAVADGTAYDLAQFAPEEYKSEVLDKINHFQKRVAELENMCYNLYSQAPHDVPRKDFALWVNSNAPSHFKGFLFKLLDGHKIERWQMFKKLEEIDKVDGKTRI